MSNVYEYEYECEDCGTYMICYFDLYYDLTPYRSGRMYLSNGDPGYPPEPATCEIWKTVCSTVYDENHNEVNDEILLEAAQNSFEEYLNKNEDDIIFEIFEFHESNEPCEDDYVDDDR